MKSATKIHVISKLNEWCIFLFIKQDIGVGRNRGGGGPPTFIFWTNRHNIDIQIQ